MKLYESKHKHICYMKALEYAGNNQHIFIVREVDGLFNREMWAAYDNWQEASLMPKPRFAYEYTVMAYDDFVWTRTAIHIINCVFREIDESDLGPVHGRFNVTERAINRVRKGNVYRRYPAEYRIALHEEIGKIVSGVL